MIASCHYCGDEFADPTDLRPYGPGGADVCHDCAFATPERQEATRRAMNVTMDAAAAMSPYRSIVLDVAGFHPFTGENA